ncbi:MAG: response regulator [Bacteroidetes bacterium]|nr:response regulator [Bacteroidota bacterium]MDA0903818.1 response regulator [Bacteroidota bacterium]MDA1242502.1 response regulator [Bacteroidota bacterium]
MESPDPQGIDSPRLLGWMEENLKEHPALWSSFQALHASEFKYRNILEDLDFGYMEVDEEGNVTKVHDRFLAMTGYTRRDLLGRSGELMLDEEGRRIMDDVIERRQGGESSSYEIPIRHRLGHRIWMLITGAPIRNVKGEVVGSVGIHFDITERKELELEMQRSAHQEALARQRERKLLMKMSHELRTPINAITGLFHLLDSRGWSQEELSLWQGAQRAADMLRTAVDDILTLTKLEEGRQTVSLQCVDVVEVTSGLAQMHHLLADQKGLTLQCGCRLVNKKRRIDTDKWLQILTNLLGNAIKYTSKGDVVLDIWEEPSRPDWIYAEVSDTGPGIAESHRELVFTPFGSSGELDSANMGSSGLGLSIARELAELMGGSLLLMPSEVGSTFLLELPASTWSGPAKEVAQGQDLSVPSWDGTGTRVLMAEDNELNVMYAKALMNQWKVDLTLVSNGQEAVRACRDQTFDVVLLDIQMPVMDGLEALAQIRAAEGSNLHGVPVYMVTAYADEGTRHRALVSGCTGFVAKPFTPTALLEAISSRNNK